jgi:hypothetical protein
MFQEPCNRIRGKRSPPADRSEAHGLRKPPLQKMLLKKMLQHITPCVALHNIVCLTGHRPSLMMVSANFPG